LATGITDTGITDTGITDTGITDTGITDTGITDTGITDTGITDIGITELFGFAVSAHPLDLFPDIAWATYCPVNQPAKFVGQTASICGLVVEQRIHHQITGEPMKFLSLADWTGIIETELFAKTYKAYGLAHSRELRQHYITNGLPPALLAQTQMQFD
jgi:hypothetical protein